MKIPYDEVWRPLFHTETNKQTQKTKEKRKFYKTSYYINQQAKNKKTKNVNFYFVDWLCTCALNFLTWVLFSFHNYILKYRFVHSVLFIQTKKKTKFHNNNNNKPDQKIFIFQIVLNLSWKLKKHKDWLQL